MTFASNDVNKFLVGSEECVVYQGQRHGAKPGTSIHFEGHSGPITAVRSHRAAGTQVWDRYRDSQVSQSCWDSGMGQI